MLQSREDRRLEETKRISRVLRMVQIISAQPRSWTRKKLAQEFEMSERMVDNDLQLIRHGLRYELRRGNGGYFFEEAPVLKPVALTVPEALALILAAQGARQTGTVDGAIIASALTRLEGGLPPRIVPYLRRADVAASDPVFGPARERVTALATLERAQVEGRKVRMTYITASRSDARSERVIAPYALQFYERSWIVIAQDSLRDDVRIFKVDRIESCALTDERYAIPANFNVGSYLGAGWGILRGEAGPVEEVVLRFTPTAAAWVRDERWHWSQDMATQQDGSLIVRFRCGVNHEMVRWLLSFGEQVTVEQTPELRKALMDEAGRIVERHGDVSPTRNGSRSGEGASDHRW